MSNLLRLALFSFLFLGSISTIVYAGDCSDDLKPYSDAVGGKQRFGFTYFDRIVIPAQFESYGGSKNSPFCNGLGLVMKDGKWGFIDKLGNTVVPFQYDQANNFSQGIASVHVPGGWTFIDRDGKNLCTTAPFFYVDRASEGRIGVRNVEKDGRITFGFIDMKCQPMGKVAYENAGDFHGQIAPVKENGKWFWLDYTGKPFGMTTPMDSIPEYREQGFWEIWRNDLKGLVGAQGKVVLEPLYLSVQLFDGKTIGVYGADRKWAFYDTDKQKFLTSFLFAEIRGFSEGLAGVRIEESTSLKPNPWGFIDSTGTWVIPAGYMWILKDFEKGRAYVELRENIYVATLTRHWIDKTGHYIDP